MEQVYTPRINTPAIAGWCLKYIDDAGDAPNRTATARYSWEVERNAGRIRTDAIPENIWLVGWLDFTAGMYTTYGHVFFIKRNGNSYQIYDSEVQSGQRRPYGSIEELLAWFGAYKPKYLGWSTHCDGREYARIKENNMAIIQNQENWFQRVNDTHQRILNRDISRDSFKSFVGKDFLTFVEYITAGKEAADVQEWQKLGKIAKQDGWELQIVNRTKERDEARKKVTELEKELANKPSGEYIKVTDLYIKKEK